MKYLLKINALGQFPEIDLSEEHFKAIKNAKKALTNGLEMEEKYEILIENYLDFEKELLERSALLMVRHPREYGDFFEATLSFNRRIVNLLTACRFYVDQIPSNIKRIMHDEKYIKDEVKQLLATEYDNNPEYRFMEALRNHTQHHGTLVHWTQFNSFSDESKGPRKLIYSMEIASQKIYLAADNDFKKLVLNEIPDEIDLKASTRVYVECISRVHKQARDLVKKRLDDSRVTIEQAFSSYAQVYNEKILGLNALCLDGQQVIENHTILLKWDDVRLRLVQRNSELINLRHRHVTNEIKSV